MSLKCITSTFMKGVIMPQECINSVFIKGVIPQEHI